MNIFLYSTSKSHIAENYFKQLQNFSDLVPMTVLPAGKLFQSSVSLKLRSGDLIILFVADSPGLDELLTLRNEVNGFRIILIVPDNEDWHKTHLLQPSFIAFQNEPLMKIEAVIQNIIRRQDA